MNATGRRQKKSTTRHKILISNLRTVSKTAVCVCLAFFVGGCPGPVPRRSADKQPALIAPTPEETTLKTEQIGPVTRAHLENGLTVVLEENHSAPVVAIQVWVETGSADEAENEMGLAHLHEHMLFKGTRKRAVGEIAKAIEGAGGEINAWTSFDETVYHVVLASRYLDLGLDVLADAVFNATFDAGELEREKQVVLEEIKHTRDLPERWLGDLLFGLAYRVHPYRHPILGTRGSVSHVTRKALINFYRRNYVPANITLVITGDFKTGTALSRVNKFFSVPTGKTKPVRVRPPEPRQRKLRLRLVKDDIKETHFGIAWHIPAVTAADAPALDLLAVIMGQGESSRLSLGLKRGLNLVNEIHAYAYTPKDPGLFVVGGSCPPAKTRRALAALTKQIGRLSGDGVTLLELAKAKAIIESEAIYSRETVEGLARRLGYHQVVGGDPSYGEIYLQRVLAQTPEDIRRVAATYIEMHRASGVLLVPEKATLDLDARLARSILEDRGPGKAAKKTGHSLENDIKRVAIDNGPVVIVQEDHSNALVSMHAVLPGGVRYETDVDNGINNLLAAMLTRGTQSHDAREIAEEMDRMAGILEGFSGRNTIGLRADIPARHFDRALELLCDCLLHPTLPDQEVKRERQLTLEEIRARGDNLAGTAFDLFTSTLYRKHPYRLPTMGTLQSVAGLKRRKLVEYWSKHFSPRRMVFSVVGDVDSERVVSMVRTRCIGKAKKIPGLTRRVFPLEPPAKKIRTAVKIRDRAQAHLVLGFRGTTMSSDDRYPLEVLLAVLAGQGGRLFVELRDRLSLAYTVSAFSLDGIEPGYIAVYLATDPSKADQAITAVKRELQRLIEKPASQTELKRAQRYLVGNQAISLQRASSRSAVLAFCELYGLGYLSYQKYPQRILEVNTNDLSRVAKKYLKLDAYTLAVVRPGKPPNGS
ncbi:MAG TPA: pitrilysin family protein [Myxococcota bacterium]|nr:pitrilysin family protein [Myxococcota bacterium]